VFDKRRGGEPWEKKTHEGMTFPLSPCTVGKEGVEERKNERTHKRKTELKKIGKKERWTEEMNQNNNRTASPCVNGLCEPDTEAEPGKGQRSTVR
jgi:hypothetical protein